MIANLKNALLSRLGNYGTLGMLHEYQRYAKRPQELIKFYQDGSGKFCGGYLSWPRGNNKNDSMGLSHERTINLVLFRGLEDAEQSELLFDMALDQLMIDFAQNKRCGDWRVNTSWDLLKNEPAMMAGVLVHYAVLQSTWTKLGG